MAKTTKMVEVAVSKLRPYANNAKIHGEEQVEKIAASISEFGFLSPCLIDKDFNLIAGHGRVEAAKKLGLDKVPCVYIEGLTEAQRRAYIIADNRLTELGGWDDELLDSELRDLYADGFDVDLTGFDLDIEEEDNDEKTDEKLNPVAALPESRLFVFAVSAFGVSAERFIEITLSPDEAKHLIKKADELSVGEIAGKLREAVNGL